MMWQCECGCRGIAADLSLCPMCRKERDMPKATSGGASNAWEQPDGDVFEMSASWEPEPAAVEPEGVSEPAAEQPAEPVPAPDEPASEPEPVAPALTTTRSRKA